jgi:hypothetical protein
MDLLMLIGMLWSLVREGDIMEVAIPKLILYRES